MSYFLARAFPPLRPILRRNSLTSSFDRSFLDTPGVYNLAARLSSGVGRMICPEKTLQAVTRNEDSPPKTAHLQMFQGDESIDRPKTHAEHSRCFQFTQSQRFRCSCQD